MKADDDDDDDDDESYDDDDDDDDDDDVVREEMKKIKNQRPQPSFSNRRQMTVWGDRERPKLPKAALLRTILTTPMPTVQIQHPYQFEPPPEGRQIATQEMNTTDSLKLKDDSSEERLSNHKMDLRGSINENIKSVKSDNSTHEVNK